MTVVLLTTIHYISNTTSLNKISIRSDIEMPVCYFLIVLILFSLWITLHSIYLMEKVKIVPSLFSGGLQLGKRSVQRLKMNSRQS